ncbi:hypothetical protein [Pontimicrobium sp. SW4]|uniref:Uncharacterized protein n=1 Tax=Pontimicrobium sp. SW4 TaxID=3153519 RepID=A0AAU7BQQ7_9FLAO
MKRLILILCLIVFSQANAQEKKSNNSDVPKDEKGISLTAPEGVYQYAFRIGEWDGISRSLISRYEWKTDSSSGSHRVYLADNGLTFIEEGIDDKGNITHKITYDYIEATDSWENNYSDNTGEKVKYSSKVVDGNMVETIVREDSTNNNTYTVLADNIYIYTARRTFGNGYTIVNHVSIATKKPN